MAGQAVMIRCSWVVRRPSRRQPACSTLELGHARGTVLAISPLWLEFVLKDPHIRYL